MATVNDMAVKQAGTILSSLVQQATGQAVITPSTPGEFVSVATTALKTGADPILNALSQMWGRTIFLSDLIARCLRVWKCLWSDGATPPVKSVSPTRRWRMTRDLHILSDMTQTRPPPPVTVKA